MASASRQTRFTITGMDCAGCATKIENAVRRIKGVEDMSVSVMKGSMTLHDDGHANLDEVEKRVTALGFSIALQGTGEASEEHKTSSCCADHNHSEPHSPQPLSAAKSADTKSGWFTPKAQATLLCAVALGVAFIAAKIFPQTADYSYIIAMSVGLIPIARRAWAGIFSGTPFSIETLMTVAAIGAVVIGATEEAAVVVLLFLVGEMLEGLAAQRARASITALADLLPKTALLESEGQVKPVPAEELEVGAIILVRPGDRISADGTIISGESDINEAPVTGESVPKRKAVGAPVFAGTMNGEAVLRVRVTASMQDNTISRVIALVEEAQESKAPTERFIDSFSRYYTPGIMIIALLVGILPPVLGGGEWATWIYRSLAILLIGCPCALVISTPAAIAAGLSTGARRGLLMKGGAVLEGFRKVDYIAFDKTGTLTEGKPKVTDIIPVELTSEQVLSCAASLEAGSSHPLAMAILSKAEEDQISLSTVENGTAIAGKGITGIIAGEALFLGSLKAAQEKVTIPEIHRQQIENLNSEGKTVSILISGNKLAGFIAMRDEPREDAQEGLKRLQSLGVKTLMLTGDNQNTAEAIGSKLGIAVRAGLLPQNKQTIVSELRQSGHYVLKVGDGINDAPALATADIGVAMGSGTDVALETADAASLHGRVSDIARMMTLSKLTMGNIKQNITIALGLKAFFLVTTVLGITGLWPAILADTGATVLVTANAMRLLGVRLT